MNLTLFERHLEGVVIWREEGQRGRVGESGLSGTGTGVELKSLSCGKTQRYKQCFRQEEKN